MGFLPQQRLRSGWIPRLAVALAVATTLLLGAGRAEASATHQCLGELASWIPEPPAPPQCEDDAYWELWMCDAAGSRPVSYREVPICLSEGASAIAPRTVLPTDDSRIEATPRCNPLDRADQWAASPEDRPDHPAPLLGDVVLPAPPSPPPLPVVALLLPRRLIQGEVTGHRFAVYRPPRG